MSITTWLINVSVWLYSLLLLTYPPTFRWEYGEAMTQLFRDMLRDGIRQKGCLGIVEVWVCISADWMATVRQQHLFAGSYYRFHRTLVRVMQGIIAAIFLIGSSVYWWYIR